MDRPPSAEGTLSHKRRARVVLILATVVALGAAAALALVIDGSTASSGTVGGESVVLTTSRCAPGWSIPTSGVATYEVTNNSDIAADPELVNRANGAVVAAEEVLGPGTTRPLPVRLSPGTYQWQCVFDTVPTEYSATRTLATGVPKGTASPQYIPTTAGEMSGPVTQYRYFVSNQITLLQSQVATLQNDVDAGNLAQAKVDWLTAHLTYCQIGGTYGALGGLEQTIDGTDAGLPGGVNDPKFTGFRKIEYQLWSGQPASAIAPSVEQLVTTLEQLAAGWPEAAMTANLLSTRAHEILEDTMRDTLTGNDDYGSGTEMATAWADLQGEQVVLGILKRLITERSPGLMTTVESELHTLQSEILATKVNGHWTPLNSLTTLQREQIDAAMGQAVETLSAIPDLLEVQEFANFPGAS